jgi:hypothetical protein
LVVVAQQFLLNHTLMGEMATTRYLLQLPQQAVVGEEQLSMPLAVMAVLVAVAVQHIKVLEVLEEAETPQALHRLKEAMADLEVVLDQEVLQTMLAVVAEVQMRLAQTQMQRHRLAMVVLAQPQA